MMMVLHEVSFFLACVGLVLIGLEVHQVNGEYNCEYKKDGFYADDDFCHIYWRCNYGVAEEYECPAGTAWNHLESRCDWLDNVDCTRVKNKEESGDDKDDEDKENLTSDDDTTKKAKKSKKTTTEREEQQQQQQHSVTTTNESPDDVTDHKIADLFTSSSGSDKQPNSNTNSNPNAMCQPFGSYYIPDNSNCMSYYFCNNGVETKMTCSEKKLFNSETSQCEDYQHVFCDKRPVNMADRNQCTGKRDGIYPDVERTCRVFYQCINQVKIREASCPSILRFNSISGKCDNPINIIAPCGTIGAVNQATTAGSFTKHTTTVTFLALVVLLLSTVFLL